MTAPVRIQLSRRKGWRMPANTVSVARPTKWGNPFKVGATIFSKATRASVVADFRDMVASVRGDRGYPSAKEIEDQLRGKNLACWCALDQPCHADVLLDLANSDSGIEARRAVTAKPVPSKTRAPVR